MTAMSKKVDTSGIDAAMVIGQAKKSNRVTSPVPAPDPLSEPELVSEPLPEIERESEGAKERERSKRKRTQVASYKETFIKRNEMKLRQCVYISHEVHSVITKLVRALADAGNDITVGGYIDTVMNEHLQLHKEEINALYRERQGNLL